MEVRAISPGLEVPQFQHQRDQKSVQSSHPENMTDQWNPSLNENQHFPQERSHGNWARIFALTVAATALIVGGAVGGGLGASLANCRQNLRVSSSASENNLGQCENMPLTTITTITTTTKDSPSTTTSSAAFETTTGGLLVNYTAEPRSKVFSVDVDCDALAASMQVTQAQEKFLVYCGVDFGTGNNRVDREGNNVVLADIVRFTTYSMQDCLEACSQYTIKSQLWGVSNSCGSVNFQVGIAKNPTGNCWLKNSTITHNPGTGGCDQCISATKIG